MISKTLTWHDAVNAKIGTAWEQALFRWDGQATNKFRAMLTNALKVLFKHPKVVKIM